VNVSPNIGINPSAGQTATQTLGFTVLK